MNAPAGVSAFVLAGGESSRMGRDKALLVLPTGEALLDRALHTAKMVADTVTLVAGDARYSEMVDVPVVRDIYPGCGPLAGIHAALSASASELNLVLGVDCPLVTPELLRFLVRIAAGTDKLATVPRVAGHLHNVCAVYRREFVEIAGRVLAASGGGKRHGTRIDCLFSEAPCRIVEEGELGDAGFGAELFANVNTPADFAALRLRMRP
jgi:molybdopterin-guanine dinucleotide biosynthesis protein A